MKLTFTKFNLALLLISISGTFMLNSCKQDTNKVKAFKWLEGTWETIDSNFVSVETWQTSVTEEGDTVMLGINFQVENGDTLFKEKLSLRALNDTIYYIAMPEGSLPTKYLVTKTENRSFTAENKKHDFPEKIYYDSPGESTLKATVSGRIRDKVREINFTWKFKELGS